MLEQKYLILTSAIFNFHEIIYDWVVARKSGLYVTGLHRQGKTTAIASVILELRNNLPFVAFLSCIGQRLTNKSKEAFFLYLLSCFNCPALKIGRNVRPDIAVANFIMVSCAEVGGNQCVLFIDEAQLFSVVHYRYLLELWNILKDRGFILTTILVGQPDLKHLREITGELDHGAVVSRFFVKGHTLTGIKSQKILCNILSQFDSKLFYPAESEWPYSRFFMKEAFDNGWRLEKEGENYWPALCNCSQAKSSDIEASGFRMAWVLDTVHGFFLDCMELDNPGFHGSIPLWDSILRDSTDVSFLL